MTNDTGTNDIGAAMQLSQLPSQAIKLTVVVPANPKLVSEPPTNTSSAGTAPAPNSSPVPNTD